MCAMPLMSMGLRALAANYAALQTAGHNIANASVAGFSRQQVELATAGGQLRNGGFIGSGVDVATVSRAHDSFLSRESALTRSVAAMDAARLAQLRGLESVFAIGETGIGHAATSFLNAFSDLAARPADTATRQVVLARAGELAQRFQFAGEQFEGAQRNVTEQLKTEVGAINALARNIAAANQQIVAARGLGQPPNDLLDERDRLVGALSAKLQVTTLAAEDGSIAVFFGAGQRLVLGNQAQSLQVLADPDDPQRSALGSLEGGRVGLVDSAALLGGAVAGLLRFQNDDLVRGRTLLGQMAAGIAGAVNDQHRLGLNLREPPTTGQALFTAVDALVGGSAVPAASNARDGQGRFAAMPSFTVVDASALQASEYALQAVVDGGATRWTARRLSDGWDFAVEPGRPIDGLLIDLGDPPPAAGDRFLLQPVSRAANRMAVQLSDPRDLAAAAPLTASASLRNAGTMSVAGLDIAGAPEPQHTATITFSSDDGDYVWELRDRDSNAQVAGGTGRWRAGEPIPAPPDADINGFGLRIAGLPRSGDSVVVERTQYPAANNGNARSLTALADRALLGQPAGGALTISDGYASAIAEIGMRVQGARTSADIAAAMADHSANQQAQRSGVNLDEEAARLMQFQQAYQAAAKVLQVAQTVFDTLLSTTRG